LEEVFCRNVDNIIFHCMKDFISPLPTNVQTVVKYLSNTRFARFWV
jgi:hypothetical protein